LGLCVTGCEGGGSPTTPEPVVVATPVPTPVPTPTPLPGYPPYPVLVAPADGAVLDTYPRTVALEWAAVTDSTGVRFYRIEIELGYPGQPDTWTPIPQGSGYYGDCAGHLTRTSCSTTNFPGAQPGRWRVIVANGEKRETASVWRTFRFSS
jgi:hypothetical protein